MFNLLIYNIMKRNLLFLALVAFGFSNGQNVFRDDFSTLTAPATWTGQGTWSNSTSTGFPGTGGCSGTGCVLSQVLASPVSYTGYGSSTKCAELRQNSDGVGTFFPVITTPDIYVGMVVNITNSSTTPQDHFRVYNNGSFIETAFRMFIKQNGFDFQVGIAKAGSGNPIVYAPNLLALGSDHLIILKFNQLPGTNDDSIAVYVDPNYAAGQPANPDAFNNQLANVNFVDQSGSIRMMAFRQNSNNNLPTGKTGLISVSTTWAGLGFLPLANDQFSKLTFEINTSQVNQGLLNIKSALNLENVSINIYDIQGRIIENKIVPITESNNEIEINPISTSGIYIIEIVSGDRKIAQKIAVQ
jgi:Secretion system C-terminal sorting domain